MSAPTRPARASSKRQGTARALRMLRLVEQLATGLPRRDSEKLRRRLAKLVAAAYHTDHRPIPAWVTELKRRI